MHVRLAVRKVTVRSRGECRRRGPFLFCVSGKGLICSPFLTMNLRDKLESEEKNDFKQSKLSKWGSTASAWVSPNIFINNAEISSFERKTLQPAVSTVSSFFNSSAGIKIHKKEVPIKRIPKPCDWKGNLARTPTQTARRASGGSSLHQVVQVQPTHYYQIRIFYLKVFFCWAICSSVQRWAWFCLGLQTERRLRCWRWLSTWGCPGELKYQIIKRYGFSWPRHKHSARPHPPYIRTSHTNVWKYFTFSHP